MIRAAQDSCNCAMEQRVDSMDHDQSAATLALFPLLQRFAQAAPDRPSLLSCDHTTRHFAMAALPRWGLWHLSDGLCSQILQSWCRWHIDSAGRRHRIAAAFQRAKPLPQWIERCSSNFLTCRTLFVLCSLFF